MSQQKSEFKVELDFEIDANDFEEYDELCKHGSRDDYLYSELKKVFGKSLKKTG